MKSPITTHVLDTTQGAPARGVPVVLEMKEKSGRWKELARGTTNNDGRIPALLPENHKLERGSYRIIFDTETYFASQGLKSMFLSVVIPFEVKNKNEHYHIPLLLSPFGYTTYRGG
jgi:5-hydroxyisourate hydrolase